jgi:hypothetical protein
MKSCQVRNVKESWMQRISVTFLVSVLYARSFHLDLKECYSAYTIAADSNLRFSLRQSWGLDVEKPTGPATILLPTCRASHLKELSKLIGKPVNLIDTLA